MGSHVSLSTDNTKQKITDWNQAEDNEQIIYQGYLRKESLHLNKIRKRWMVLTSKCLYSYKSESSAIVPTETFDLSIYDQISNDHDEKKEYKFELSSSVNKRQRTFITQTYEEMLHWINSIQSIQNKHTLFGTMLSETCNQHNGKECNSIERIINLLNEYQSYSNELSAMDMITNKFGANYAITQILNDYIHITTKHDNMLEEIYNKTNIKCQLNECMKIMRNFRHKRQNSDNDLDESVPLSVDILDQIHCYILHSFDTGFRILQNDTKHIYNDSNNDEADVNILVNNVFLGINKILFDGRSNYRKIANLSTRHYSKFVTNIPNDTDDQQTKDEHKSNGMNEEEKKQRADDELSAYSFSHRFYYWEYYQNNNSAHYEHNPLYTYSDLYVPQKYNDFKEELLTNLVHCIDKNIWQRIYQKAEQYMLTDQTKEIEACYGSFGDHQYGVEKGVKISIFHLMSIMFYTDYDDLCYKYSETFRFIKKDKNNLKNLIQRHSNFHWFAKYMRETVELYGEYCQYQQSLYHGISKIVLFPSTVCYFNSPTSTTKEITVAANFATNNGMIIALEAYGFVSCFDCGWLSKYGNESEILFIGGNSTLNITNIIECQNGNEYKKYLSAFNKLVRIMNGEHLRYDANSMDRR